MELSEAEREKIYLEEKTRLEAQHFLQSQMKENDENPATSSETMASRSALSSRLSYSGVTLTIFGISLLVYFGCMFSVSVPVDMPTALQQFVPAGHTQNAVNNIGLMSERQNGLIVGGFSSAIGAFLLIAGLILGLGGSESAKTRIGLYTVALAVFAIVVLFVAPTSRSVRNSSASDKVSVALHLGPDPSDSIARARLQQIGLAIANFSQDNNLKFPNFDTNDDVKAEISQFGLNQSGGPLPVEPEAFIDPSSNQPWKFNDKFSGLNSMSDTNFTAGEIIAYSPVPTWDGHRYCLYADGHTKKLSKEKWDQAIKAVRLQLDPQDHYPQNSTLTPQ